MSDRPRVVITGLGLVTALGIGREENWANAVAGRSGAAPISTFDPADNATTIACQVRDFDPTDFMDRRSARRMDRFAQFAVAAARLAVADAGLEITEAMRPRAGAIVGSGIGGLDTFVEQTLIAHERGPDRVSPLFIPMVIANMAGAQVSMELGLKGPLSCISTACASGNHALGDATEVIRRGQADVMLAGGTESSITRTGIAAFNSMRALSTRNDDPAAASRPFDAARDGFVMGEAGAILVLESLDHALARGATPICEVLGYGMTGDAHHLTEPDPTSEAPAAAIAMALDDAGLAPNQVDYVNAHATSTPVGDKREIEAIREVFGDDIPPISATKSLTGHSLGAAGAHEAIYSILMMENDFICESANIEEIDPEFADLPIARRRVDGTRLDVVLSNSFGFGGTNASLVLQRYDA
jgi:3-oxoacyl-[acyl-carrier-protein] synthase II